VRVGPELRRSDAQIIKEKLKSTMQIEGIIVHYP
jgi:cell division septation protein DedD